MHARSSRDTDSNLDKLLTSADVRRHYAISDTSLWRWLKDESLNFPRPMVINRRRRWRLGDIIAFDERQRQQAA